MEIEEDDEETQFFDQLKLPLLSDKVPEDQIQKSLIQKAIRKTFKSTAHISNLLPTGTVLAFQLLSPAFTNQGQCSSVNKCMEAGLISLCAISCMLSCFTDSFKDQKGKIRYGIATIRGLRIIDGPGIDDLPEYRIRVMDFIHGFFSLLVFSSVTLLDQNVVRCFYPMPSEKTKQLLASLPVGIGIICSLFFANFPTKRRGIGFPLSK